MLSSMPPEILEAVAFAAVCIPFDPLSHPQPSNTSGTSAKSDNGSIGSFLGPPSALLPLLLTSRRLHACLCADANPVLYSRIFQLQFDGDTFASRCLSSMQDAQVQANELKRRWTVLKLMRAGTGSTFNSTESDFAVIRSSTSLVLSNRSTLYTAYLLMLENTSGKNTAQLCGYGNARTWLRTFLFDPEGGSGAGQAIAKAAWPLAEVCSNVDDIRTQNDSGDGVANTLALWLFWFLFRAEDYPEGPFFHTVTSVLKLFALGAHHYALASPSWADFIPTAQNMSSSRVNANTSPSIALPAYYPRLIPPPAATPAILAFLALIGSPTVGMGGLAYSHVGRYGSTELADTTDYTKAWIHIGNNASGVAEAEWESEWGRCVRGGRYRLGTHHGHNYSAATQPPEMRARSRQNIFKSKIDVSSVEPVFKRGSVEGVWEGMFTYLEFTTYSALLSGAPPAVLQRSLVVRHRQTWRLREWWLMTDEENDVTDIQDSWFNGSGINEHGQQEGWTHGGDQLVDGDVDGHVDVIQVQHDNVDANDSRKMVPPSDLGGNSEYLSAPSSPSLDASTTPIRRLAAGPALRSYIPVGTRLTESVSGITLEVWEPPSNSGVGSPGRELIYSRAETKGSEGEDADNTKRVRDVIITGEGHSAWGQFNLVGRVRPCDGFVCLTKEYTDGDRGRWLYRGLLVGDSRRSLAGRWRDTLSPAEVQGYEGCFTMARRQ